MSKRIVRLHIIRYLHYFGKRLTDRFSKVYNPLNKLVRRIKLMNIMIAWVTVGIGSVATGFVLFLNGIDEGNSFFVQSGAGIIITGLIIWVLAIYRLERAERAERADKTQELQKQMQTLVQTFVQSQEKLVQTFVQSQDKLMQTFTRELKGFREDIGNRDKGIKARPKIGKQGKRRELTINDNSFMVDSPQ